MLANLQQLPLWVWGLALLVIVLASGIVIWVRRNYKLGKLTLKTGPVEAELERKTDGKPATEATAPKSSTVAPPPVQPLRTQEMTRSDDGEQAMHGNKGVVQKQKMTDSPHGKQTMD